jgi:hypothetical protein
MKTPVSTSPMRLALWVGAGCVLAMTPFVPGVLVHVPRLPASGYGLGAILWADRLRLLVFFVPFAIGMTVSTIAESRLRRGIDNELWQESEVELFRGRMAHPVWNVFAGLVLMAWLGYAFTANFLHGTWFWCLMVPMQSISRLRMMARPQRVSEGGGLKDWRNFNPIQSEHWGESGRGSLSL